MIAITGAAGIIGSIRADLSKLADFGYTLAATFLEEGVRRTVAVR